MAYQLNDSFQRYIIKTSKYILQDLNLSISEVAEYQQHFTFQAEELFVETKGTCYSDSYIECFSFLTQISFFLIIASASVEE